MSLSSTTSRVSFAGNGSTTVFSFPYYFLANADLVVIDRVDSTGVETVKTITTHYTVSGAGVSAGGSVTMLSAPASGHTLIIYRDPTVTQGVDLAENDSLPAETLEQALDRAAMISQRLDSRMDRAVRLSEGFSPTFDLELPSDLDSAADLIPTINATGDGWADVADWPSAADIAAAETNAAAAAASATAAAASAASAALGAAQVTGTWVSPSAIVAGTGIAFSSTSYNNLWFVKGTGGVTVTVDPPIAVPSAVGQRLQVICTSDTDTLTLNGGSHLILSGDTFVGGMGAVLELVAVSTSIWLEKGRAQL